MQEFGNSGNFNGRIFRESPNHVQVQAAALRYRRYINHHEYKLNLTRGDVDSELTVEN